MKHSLAFLAFFLFVGLVIITFSAWRDGALDGRLLTALVPGALRDDDRRVIEPNVIRDGEIVCLRRKDGGRDRECVQGLQTQDGIYRLLDVERAGPVGTIQTGGAFRIMGDIFESPAARQYEIVGDLEVERVERLILE